MSAQLAFPKSPDSPMTIRIVHHCYLWLAMSSRTNLEFNWDRPLSGANQRSNGPIFLKDWRTATSAVTAWRASPAEQNHPSVGQTRDLGAARFFARQTHGRYATSLFDAGVNQTIDVPAHASTRSPGDAPISVVCQRLSRRAELARFHGQDTDGRSSSRRLHPPMNMAL